MITIVTWLWSGATMGPDRVTYTADHVNRLFNALRRNTTQPFRAVCVTDMSEDIDSSIECIPLWPDLCQYGRCYRRLKMFDPKMRDLFGPRILSIDLDTVVCGNVDHLLTGDEPFAIWHVNDHTPYCGSIWRLDIGFMPEVFTEFQIGVAASLRDTYNFIGSDQAWMSYVIPKTAARLWTEKDGIYSFRLHFHKPFQSSFKRVAFGSNIKAKRKLLASKNKLPDNACLVFFHGSQDPSQTHLYMQNKWIEEHWR